MPSIPGGAQEILRLVLHFSFLLPETSCWHHLRDPSYVMHERPAPEVSLSASYNVILGYWLLTE